MSERQSRESGYDIMAVRIRGNKNLAQSRERSRCGHIFMIVLLACSPLLPPPTIWAEEPEEKPRLPLAMEVFLKKPSKRVYELHVHLTNISPEPITVDVHELPWIPPNDSKWLEAVQMEAPHHPIKREAFRGHFGSRTIRLLPGESIQDAMALNPRIPSLLDDIAQSGVQLHWDCPPTALRFVCQSGSPQTLTIPKGDPGHPDTYAINEQGCRRMEHAIGLTKNFQHEDVLFVVTTESVLTDLAQAQALLYRMDDYVRKCKPKWTNSWAVSFFTDEKYAGFISDLENQRYFERGLWQQANIGQYSSQIRTLFRFPWISNKSDSVYLSVYRPSNNGHAASHDHPDGK